MGACDFHTYQEGSDARKAFEAATDRARYMSGHGGYTGTIAEKSSFTVLKHTPMLKQDAQVFADSVIEKNDKWGPAFAVPIADEKEPTKTKGWYFFGFASS